MSATEVCLGGYVTDYALGHASESCAMRKELISGMLRDSVMLTGTN